LKFFKPVFDLIWGEGSGRCRIFLCKRGHDAAINSRPAEIRFSIRIGLVKVAQEATAERVAPTGRVYNCFAQISGHSKNKIFAQQDCAVFAF